jgi:phosphoribosylformylglycinamidine (FGAM) synthase-like amidotransferase family enzyme
VPIAHGEGCYVAADDVLDRLEGEDRVDIPLLRSERPPDTRVEPERIGP